MRNLKQMTIFGLLICACFASNAFAQKAVGITEFNIKLTSPDGKETTISPDFAVGVGSHLGDSFKVAVKVGGEQYKTCSRNDSSSECQTAYDLLGEIEAGILSESFAANLVGRLTESKTLGGLKLEIPIFDDNAAINLKALFGEDRNINRSVSEYGAGVTVRF